MAKLMSPGDLEALRQDILARRDPAKPCVTVCAGTGCLAVGAAQVVSAFAEELRKRGLDQTVDLRPTGCPGFCEKGPIVVIYPDEICYVQVKPGDVPQIVSQTLIEKKMVDRLLYRDPMTGVSLVQESEIPFYKHQTRLLLANNSRIDPRSIDDYIALGGYSALVKALTTMTPEGIIDEIKQSGLRGRGGAGFPTGRKWEECRRAPGEPKYVIVNADEGDPGAFMDRSLLEGNPHSVLEGLIIGGYAIGSHHGFVYVRHEYPLAVENVTHAIRQAEEYGLLGRNILGSGFDFTVDVHRGAGAFVSGESSALMTALEGRVGEPRPKHIHTVVSGVWGKPSCLNNVETWANVPLIINRGADWFASIGTAGSKGTKIFSLVGKVKNTGLVEVPMGISLRDIVYLIGGGVPKGKKLKAVQTGGPSGGCIPEHLMDVPVDFDELTKLGSMMGSGGMIVMDEDSCMVEVARYFTDFLCDESCGKCLPCREGLRRMREILTDITEGRGQEGDVELLEELAGTVAATSLCALGKTAPNPVLTTLRYFRDEYEAHIREKRCPAFQCKALTSFYIDPQKCKACMICLRNCPAEAISGGKGQVHVIDQSRCTRCGTCYDVCPPHFGAVRRVSGRVEPALLAPGKVAAGTD
ncbi:MAG: NADH-quinone oxidoreductase subunit NuoF [Bacillota bacterium]|nr:NADH-quinone oxidoreductase subunit NuoF [Bacillota bacterium]